MNTKELKSYNPNEEAFADILIKRGIAFERQYMFHKFHVEQGEKYREFKVDFAVPPKKIIFEIEGGIWSAGRHVRPKGYIEDCVKYNLATACGWDVYRIPTDWLKNRSRYQVLMYFLDDIFKGE